MTDSDGEELVAGVMRLIKQKGYVDNVIKAIAYAGFDAVVMREKIYETICRNRQDRAHVLKDLFCLCSIGLRLGNNLERISKSLKRELMTVFMTLKWKLKLVSKAAGKADALTLSRVISCFPEVAVAILDKADCILAIPYESLTAIYEEFPLVARHQVCASIIDTTLPRDQLGRIMDVIMVPFMLMSNLINSRNSVWNSNNKTKQFVENFSYLQKSFECKIANKAVRRKTCISYKIINETGNMTATWEAASGKCKEWLIDNYGCSSSDHIGSWSVDGADL